MSSPPTGLIGQSDAVAVLSFYSPLVVRTLAEACSVLSDVSLSVATYSVGGSWALIRVLISSAPARVRLTWLLSH